MMDKGKVEGENENMGIQRCGTKDRVGLGWGETTTHDERAERCAVLCWAVGSAHALGGRERQKRVGAVSTASHG